MTNVLWLSLGWILAASLLGLAISGLFSGWLNLARRTFLIPYVLLTGAFLYGFVGLNAIDVGALVAKNWVTGLIAGILVAVFLVRNVRSQAASQQASRGQLALDLGWLGLVYGTVDALFLNIMPVIAVWQGFSWSVWNTSIWGRMAIGALALAASLLVTLAYHVGYREFRNRSVGLVLVGNGLITMAFLLSGNPLGALISHTAMHVAAVMQGPETTIQLPPHLAGKGS